MGQDIERRTFTPEDRTRFRQKLRRCLQAHAQMLEEGRFDVGQPFVGFEIEFNLVDHKADPALRNSELLHDLGDPAFQTELAQYNIEVNVAPRRLEGSAFKEFEDDLRARIDAADATARRYGVRLAMVGILPTVTTAHMTFDALSARTRYRLLNDQIILARGEDIQIMIEGEETLAITTDSVAPESACTSTQVHLQLSQEAFPAYWNAAQAIAGPQVAVCANSPFFLGKELWRETRTKLFEQAIDTRSLELKEQGVRPRVWFGERWIESVGDLFTENVRYFPPLLPVCDDEDPMDLLAHDVTPGLSELRLHNGTIYRWNRPVYDVVDDSPHLRIENRVLPAGPTVVDTLANAAFFVGLVRRLADDDRPVWAQLSFDAAAENFFRGARFGLRAQQYWPASGMLGVPELMVRKLLPLAQEGLDIWGVDATQRDRLLGVIEQRCLSGQNGAEWQAAVFHRLYDRGGMSRLETLRAMMSRYVENMSTNAPVHTWPVE
ncbi:hypothetical protein [Actinopolymorpha alba]|uniref:hypothetical protein n=1 Tax=Actinopolymorpha alba TaxID=533267 RepID=UPI0003690317|nr:hypothetical protein [Actinopolymorpha alba]